MKNKKLLLSFAAPLIFLEFLSSPYLQLKQDFIKTCREQRIKLESAYLTYTGQSSSKAYTEADLRELAQLKAKEFGLNVFLVESLISKESGWNPEAVSSRGALGLTQIMPEWKGHKICPSYASHSDLFDPVKNLNCGLAILAHEIKSQGSVKRGLQIYNGGYSCLKNEACFAETNRYAQSILAEAQKKLFL